MSSHVDEHLSTADFVAGGGQEMAREREARPMRDEGPGPLLPGELVQEMRGRWDGIQTGFVDEPRAAVQQADELVARAMKHIAEGFANERNNLERQWDRGDQVNTEDLRQALRKYRAFFERLLSV
jgi:hypothetical protein